jgi:hypothetical protein
MVEYCLLEVEESTFGNSFVTRHLIETDNRQKAKYHFHRTLKDWGYNDNRATDYKHDLSGGPNGLGATLLSVRTLSDAEYKFLSEFLSHWTKV